MCAITLALIGHSGLDEDKCLSSGWESITPTGLHPTLERREVLINGTPDVTGLESSIISQTFCPPDHTICRPTNVLHTEYERKSDLKAAVSAYERVAEDLTVWNRIHPFIRYKMWLSAHGPLGIRRCRLLLPVIWHFFGPHPLRLCLNGGQVNRQMANCHWESIP